MTKIYPKGIFINKPREGAPDFVRGSISIKSVEALEFIKEHTNPSGYVNLDILKGEKGSYLVLNDYKKEEKKEEIKEDEIPF